MVDPKSPTLKVCIISCVMSPEPIVSAIMGSDIAHSVSERGHDVVVLSPYPSKTKGVIYEGYSRRFPWAKDLNVKEFRLIRCCSTFSKSSSLISRFFENVTFGFTSSLCLLFMRSKPDVIYINTWPIFATAMNVFLAKLFGVKVVRSVKDLYPDSLLAQDRVSKTSPLYKCLDSLERYACNKSDLNVLLSEKIAAIYKKDKGIDINYCVIRDWNSYPSQRDEVFLRKDVFPNISNESTLMIYGGNISAAANVEGLIENFASADLYNTFLLIAGSGSMLTKCQKLSESLGLGGKICFYSDWAVQDTLALLSLGDLLLLPTESTQSNYSIPSKIISYMNSARAILAFGSPGTELESLIKESGSGWYFGTTEMVDGFKAVSKVSRKELQDKGLYGKSYVERVLARDANVNQYIRTIETI